MPETDFSERNIFRARIDRNEFKLLFVCAKIGFDRSSPHFYSFVNGFCIVAHRRRNIRCIHAFCRSNRPVAIPLDMRSEQHPSRPFGDIHLPHIKTAVPLHTETETLITTIDDKIKINRIICDLGIRIVHTDKVCAFKVMFAEESRFKIRGSSQYFIVFVPYFYKPIVFRRGGQCLSPVFNGNGIVAFYLTGVPNGHIPAFDNKLIGSLRPSRLIRTSFPAK